MTLRRTALTRRTELRRGTSPMPRRRREIARRAKKTIARQRNTGPSVAQRRAVADRANYCCELCGSSLYTPLVGWTAAHSFHHRRPRGMGGTAREDTNSPANILLTCGTGTTGCHGRVEAQRAWARARGYLVTQHADPTTVAVQLHTGRLVLLTDTATYEDAA